MPKVYLAVREIFGEIEIEKAFLKEEDCEEYVKVNKRKYDIMYTDEVELVE